MMTRILVVGLIFLAITSSLIAAEKNNVSQTHRFPQFETDDVEVWRTVISPNQPLKNHRHDHSRIVVALTDTELKVTNDKGETHLLKWKKGTAHLLEADVPGELHVDVNESDRPMEVMVIQFKNSNPKGRKHQK